MHCCKNQALDCIQLHFTNSVASDSSSRGRQSSGGKLSQPNAREETGIGSSFRPCSTLVLLSFSLSRSLSVSVLRLQFFVGSSGVVAVLNTLPMHQAPCTTGVFCAVAAAFSFVALNPQTSFVFLLAFRSQKSFYTSYL